MRQRVVRQSALQDVDLAVVAMMEEKDIGTGNWVLGTRSLARFSSSSTIVRTSSWISSGVRAAFTTRKRQAPPVRAGGNRRGRGVEGEVLVLEGASA